jgi:DNA-binding XRE family transcriptional regulator
VLERSMYYHHKLDLVTIFQYPIDQTGQVCQTELLFKWAHYLELAEKLNLPDKEPTHFIVAYNHALEKVGLTPLIYEINEHFNYEYISRKGNIFELRGMFPCDEDGQPILRWIGVKIKNAKRVWAKLDKRLKGSLFIEATPTTVIWGMNCWGTDDNGSDAWYPLYVGPQMMEFDSEALRDIRNRAKLSQRQVAEAIGSSVRTYQKWESGHTTPDSHHLLRLMNVIDITDTKELTKWIDIDES